MADICKYTFTDIKGEQQTVRLDGKVRVSYHGAIIPGTYSHVKITVDDPGKSIAWHNDGYVQRGDKKLMDEIFDKLEKCRQSK